MSNRDKKTIPTSAKSSHPSAKCLITIDSTPVSKSGIVARLPGVQIPPSPPNKSNNKKDLQSNRQVQRLPLRVTFFSLVAVLMAVGLVCCPVAVWWLFFPLSSSTAFCRCPGDRWAYRAVIWMVLCPISS